MRTYISRFYFIFIIIYIPFGLFFYDYLNIQFIDEILVLLLACLLFVCLVNGVVEINKECKIFILVILGYMIYSWIFGLVSVSAILYDVQQQTKPYIVFYSTYLLKPIFSKRQRIIICYICFLLPVFALCVYFEGNISAFYGNLVALGTLCLTSAIYYYYFSRDTKIKKYVITSILLIGLLSEKAKYYGEVILFGCLLFFAKRKINIYSFKIFILGICLSIGIIVLNWNKIDFYYVSGLNEGSDLARPLSYITSLKILQDYFPLGSGFASFACNAAGIYYSPLYDKYQLSHIWGLSREYPSFIADAYYPNLAQFGIIGVIFFFLFWRKRVMELREVSDKRSFYIGLLIMFSLFIENIADTSYLSNRGVLFFLLLAIVLSNSERTFKLK